MDRFTHEMDGFVARCPAGPGSAQRLALLGKAAGVVAVLLFCVRALAAESPAAAQPPGSVVVVINYYRFGGTNYWQMRADTVAARSR